MNQPARVNVRRLAVVGAVMVIATIVLLVWAREFVREVIVLPVSYLVYLFRVLLETTPQFACWLGLLVIALMIAWRSVGRQKRTLAVIPTNMAELSYDPGSTGRVHFWSVKTNLLREMESSYYQTNFHNALGKLLLDVLAHRYRLSVPQVEDRLREDELELPPAVLSYAIDATRRLEPRQIRLMQWLWAALKEKVRGWLPGRRTAPPVDPRVAEVISYIEGELEVSYVDTGR